MTDTENYTPEEIEKEVNKEFKKPRAKREFKQLEKESENIFPQEFLKITKEDKKPFKIFIERIKNIEKEHPETIQGKEKLMLELDLTEEEFLIYTFYFEKLSLKYSKTDKFKKFEACRDIISLYMPIKCKIYMAMSLPIACSQIFGNHFINTLLRSFK